MDGNMSLTQETVLEEVAQIVREILGDEWSDDLPITMASSFGKDLELESIEFVAMAEKLKEKFGQRVDFAGWLASMELGQILALRVGDLVEFIVRCTSK
jgi:acyl carrier protein